MNSRAPLQPTLRRWWWWFAQATFQRSRSDVSILRWGRGSLRRFVAGVHVDADVRELWVTRSEV